MSPKIQAAAQARGITALFHFTPLVNLPSILAHGLVSRALLDAHDVDYAYTDSWRADGHMDAVSLSIHGINRAMLAQKKRQAEIDWVVFQVNASVLWTHPCRFCWRNAASSEIAGHRGRIDGPWAFEKMFEDAPVSAVDPRSSRSVFQTPPHIPTFEDAEVQVHAPIAPALIHGIFLEHDRHQAAVARVLAETGHKAELIIHPQGFV